MRHNYAKELLEALASARARHPVFACSDHEALTVLTEEVGEVARAILENDPKGIREELTHVVAVCLRWLEEGTV